MRNGEKRKNCEPSIHSKRARSEYGASSAEPSEETSEETSEGTSEDDGHGDENQLEVALRRMSRIHNLSKRNVRNILREVITHEHVVDMMKAAIQETKDLPPFEPKMTRSRLKKAVELGETVNWSLSAVGSSNRSSGFVDMELEEDSSDEEYCPDEDEEDTDELFLSDGDSLTSPPRPPPGSKTRAAQCLTQGSVLTQTQTAEATVSQSLKGCPLQTDTFLERLNAMDEELNSNHSYYYQAEDSLALRTRSKLTLVDVPITRLEAELLAPDISMDLYSSPIHQTTDPHWTEWLQGLIAPDSPEDAEDEDDPEYNFLEDLDEPDLEDYRTDRAVQITKKEVNELLEELFETLQDQAEEEEQEEPEEEESFRPGPELLEAPLPVNGAAVNRETRRVLQDTTNTGQTKALVPDPDLTKVPELVVQAQFSGSNVTQLILDSESAGPRIKLCETQRQHLQQQIQQHVQLLTQLHLLTKGIQSLSHEADITKLFLMELDQFSRYPCRRSVSTFKVSNLPLALELIEEEKTSASHRSASTSDVKDPKRWLPSMAPTTNGHGFALLPAQMAWTFATRPVFMYPELLPVRSFDPAHRAPRKRQVYTQGEDGLVALALKHFEGTVNPHQLIADFALCKKRSNIIKHIREMTSSRAPPNVIKSSIMSGGFPHLPVACSRVDPLDLRPPVDRDCPNCPNWLKNSQEIIQKLRLSSSPPSYPQSLPTGCTLRLHPYWLAKGRYSSKQAKRRLFTLAHNETLMPLAKKHGASEQIAADVEELNGQTLGADGTLITEINDKLKSNCTAFILAPCQNVPSNPETQTHTLLPVFPLVDSTNTAPSTSRQHTHSSILQTAAPLSSSLCPGVVMVHVTLDATLSPRPAAETDEGKESSDEREQRVSDFEEGPETGHGEGTESIAGQVEEWINTAGDKSEGRCCAGNEGGTNKQSEEGGGASEGGGSSEEGGANDGQTNKGSGEDGADHGQSAGEGGDSGGRGPSPPPGEGGGDDGGDDEDEDEEFDDLTQDEDEEEVMSSASEESVLSVPELQETMKQLTWLAAERRLGDGDSEEDLSQEDEEEDEEDGNSKGEESREERGIEISEDKEAAAGEATRRAKRGAARGRGRSRNPCRLKRSRQDRMSKDASKLLLLYDENILENDPHRDSKDSAFAQSYLSRVQEALQDAPLKMEQFVSLLAEFEKAVEVQDVAALFRKLQSVLEPRTDLLLDFAAFLRPEQALECGLFNEQQAFDRSRRFLRQLEISFGDNPSHYQKIIKALQMGPDLSPTSIHELKSQMTGLLKGHTHLQSELWVFFDELRPPPARPGQFEEAQWPEDGEGREAEPGRDTSGFEEVTLPELDEEDDRQKIQPITVRQTRRKMDAHRNYKHGDWSEKSWVCLCHDAPVRKHRKKSTCPQCKGLVVSTAMKSLHPLYSQAPGHLTEQSVASWDGQFLPPEDEDEEITEAKREQEKSREESSAATEEPPSPSSVTQPDLSHTGAPVPSQPHTEAPVPAQPHTEAPALSQPHTEAPEPLQSDGSQTVAPALSQDLTVCAKNISLTASGEKVVLWTREADRVILTRCQQDGATPATFQHVSAVLGNKTPVQVSQRFQDLMRLFHTAARQSSEDETPAAEQNQPEN